MTEHTKTDGLPGIDAPELPQVLERARALALPVCGNSVTLFGARLDLAAL